MYSYVPDKLAGLFESLSTVMAAVCEPTAVDVFLVVSGCGAERPVEGVNIKKCYTLVLDETRQASLYITFQLQRNTKCFKKHKRHKDKKITGHGKRY